MSSPAGPSYLIDVRPRPEQDSDDPPPRPPRRHRLPPPRPHGRLAWIVAMVVTDRARLLACGRVQRRLRHPGLGVEGGQRPHRAGVRRLLGPGGLRRLEGRERRRQPRGRGEASTPSSPRRREVEHIGEPTPDPDLARTARSATTTLPLTVPGWEVEKEQGEQLIAAAEENSGDGLEIKLGGDPIYQAQEATSPEGLGFLGAAIVLLIAFGSVVAAGLPLAIALVGLGHLLRRPDRPARQRRRRPRLDDGGLGADRDRRRDRLLAAGPDPLPLGDERGQGPSRRGRRGRHHRGAQRDHRRRHRGDRRARPLPDRPPLHVRRRDLGLARGAGRDARLDHAAAGAALLPRARGSTGCGSRSSAGT